MNRMFRLYAFVALTIITCLRASATVIYTEGVTPSVSPGNIVMSDGTGELNFYIDTEVTTLNTFQFDLYLPVGYTIAKNKRGVYLINVNNEDAMYSHQVYVGDHTGDSVPYYRILCTSGQAQYIDPGYNRLITFTIQSSEEETVDDTPAVLKGSLREFVFAADKGETSYEPGDIYFTINDIPTGIENVSCTQFEGSEEFIFNLQGVRVFRPLAPGFYIINGVKTIVN